MVNFEKITNIACLISIIFLVVIVVIIITCAESVFKAGREFVTVWINNVKNTYEACNETVDRVKIKKKYNEL